MADFFSGLDYGLLLSWLGGLSLVTFIGSLLVVPWLILRLPRDYFIRHRMEVEEKQRRHPALSVFLFCLRNSIGLLLLSAGIAMLVLPGQGILTMIIGLGLMDFPGKHALLELMVRNARVQRSLNWIRTKGGREELVFTRAGEELG
jgi:hypothetical protein